VGHLYQSPALGFGKRAGFLNPDLISKLCFALGIMGIALAENGNNFLESWVTNTPSDKNHNGLVHLFGDDFSNPEFAVSAFDILFRHGRNYWFIA
jgi:hypothetical protein